MKKHTVLALVLGLSVSVSAMAAEYSQKSFRVEVKTSDGYPVPYFALQVRNVIESFEFWSAHDNFLDCTPSPKAGYVPQVTNVYRLMGDLNGMVSVPAFHSRLGFGKRLSRDQSIRLEIGHGDREMLRIPFETSTGKSICTVYSDTIQHGTADVIYTELARYTRVEKLPDTISIRLPFTQEKLDQVIRMELEFCKNPQ